MNTFKVTIGDKVIKASPYGAKFGNLLDERLDEGYITLKHLKQEQPFRPFTLVKIELTNANTAYRSKIKEYSGDDITQSLSKNMLTQTKEEYFFVADDNVTNYPNGSEFYNHSLYLIEITKILERFIGDSITFTNPLNNK
nr:MAG TPA: hypothetical protein [Caudoviricetes sp.]